jgi:hypothetical protein
MVKQTKQPAALVSTIGGQAQIVTLTLDALLARAEVDGITIAQVCVLHLSDKDARIKQALKQLRNELVSHYRNPPRLRYAPVRTPRLTQDGLAHGPAIDSKASPHYGEAAYHTAYRTLVGLKTEGMRIELCCTGGPHSLGLNVFAAAGLVCGQLDRAWDLYCSPEFIERARDGAIMHAMPNDDVALLQMHLLGLGQWLPNLQVAARMPAGEIASIYRNRIDAEHLQTCEAVVRELTHAQRVVLREFARGARSVSEVAKRLHLGEDGVHSHKRVIYDVCGNHIDMSRSSKHFSFLKEQFGNLPEQFWINAGLRGSS